MPYKNDTQFPILFLPPLPLPLSLFLSLLCPLLIPLADNSTLSLRLKRTICHKHQLDHCPTETDKVERIESNKNIFFITLISLSTCDRISQVWLRMSMRMSKWNVCACVCVPICQWNGWMDESNDVLLQALICKLTCHFYLWGKHKPQKERAYLCCVAQIQFI
jgi:hypothetical protein